MARYDEDLHENLFFQTLVGKYGSLFNEAADKRWMIFVPRSDTVTRLKLTKTDFENHIVMTTENSEECSFLSVNGKHVLVDGDSVSAGQGYKEARSVRILFEECFFNSHEENYQVFCLDQPLEGALGEDLIISLENLEDCIKFLWSEAGCEKVRKSVDRLLEMFTLEGGSSMRSIMDASSAVYTRAVQEVFKLRKFQFATLRNFSKLAIETYVLAGLHKKIFKDVCFLVAQKDTVLNKITRNLSDTHPQYLGIKSQFRLCIPKARAVLSQLNQFATPLEKLYCFKKCVSALVELPLDAGTYEAVTADELLPLLVYLVIVCDIPNWIGNLTYITKLHFSQATTDEFGYYLTSFEAAVEYIRSEADQIASMSSGINQAAVQRLRSNSSVRDEDSDFFSRVCAGDVTAVRGLLEREKDEAESFKTKLCHPLCDCKRCTALIEKQMDDSYRASVFSRDENGKTGLHHAARLGHDELLNILTVAGAIVTSTDHNSSTPLHLACQKGHLKCTLLLLDDEGSSVNATDNHGNTPLHLACSNGHEECVKALLFNKEKCDVNSTNDQGDSPLHNAARWGYATIVSVLLMHGASTNTLNKRRETPQLCAQSRKVQQLLCDARKRHSIATANAGNSELDHHESPPTVRKVQMSRRMSMRESFSETDRQLKKLFRAIQDGDTNYVRYLFGWDATQSPASSEEKLCHPLCQCEECSTLRESSPDAAVLSVNCRDSQGLTPLHKAALLGHMPMVELLLRHGAQSDVITKETLQTALHLACQYNHKDVVLALLGHSAHVTPQDLQGNTPLHFTCTNGHHEAAMLLLFHGADVTIANNRGDTALHNAARWNHPILVNELMLFGAQYKATNNEGKTPLDLAKDEEVQTLIVKAISGELAVGSHAPIKPPTKATPSHSTVESPKSKERPRILSDHAHTKKIHTAIDPPSYQEEPNTVADLFSVADEAQLFSPMEATQSCSSSESDPTPVMNSRKMLNVGVERPRGSPMLTSKNERLRELLRAIESYDRTTLLKQTSTDDRSAPLIDPSSSPLTSSESIQVPTSPSGSIQVPTSPSGSIQVPTSHSESIQVPTSPKTIEVPGGSWDCVEEEELFGSR